MTHRHLIIGLPVAAIAIGVPAAAQAAPATDVQASMARYAQNTAGADAAARAATKQARYLARKEEGEAEDCHDCADCAPCEACKECDDNRADAAVKKADRNA
jgi:hypothetical protein